MKLINNRFSIKNALISHLNNEAYFVRDLMDEEKIKRLSLLQSQKI